MELNNTKKKNKHKERLLKVWSALKGGKKNNIKPDSRGHEKPSWISPILFIGLPNSGLSDLFIGSILEAYNINLTDDQKNQIRFRESLAKDPSLSSPLPTDNTILMDNNDNTNYLSLLPPEILTRILRVTNLRDLLNFSSVNKSFDQYDEFWKRYFGPTKFESDPPLKNFKALLQNYQKPFEVYAKDAKVLKWIHFRNTFEFENLQKLEENTYLVTSVDASQFDNEEYIDKHLHIVSQHLERCREGGGFPIMVVFTRVDKLTEKLANSLSPKNPTEVLEELMQRYNSHQDKFQPTYAMDQDGSVFQPFYEKKLLLEVDEGEFRKKLFENWEKFRFYTTSAFD